MWMWMPVCVEGREGARWREMGVLGQYVDITRIWLEVWESTEIYGANLKGKEEAGTCMAPSRFGSCIQLAAITAGRRAGVSQPGGKFGTGAHAPEAQRTAFSRI